MTVRFHTSHQPGDVLRVRVYGGVLHEGIYTDDGTVISSSRKRGGVFEETLQDFAGGRAVKNLGRLSDLSPHRAVARAYVALGRQYDLVNDNCQHFVRHCYGLKPKSHQRDLAVIGGAVLAVLLII